MSNRRPSALGVCVAVALLAGLAAGHGVLLQPRSRNWLAYLNERYDWADALNSGGAKFVSGNGKRQWPHGLEGMCGDKYNERKWRNSGPVQASYVEGEHSC